MICCFYNFVGFYHSVFGIFASAVERLPGAKFLKNGPEPLPVFDQV